MKKLNLQLDSIKEMLTKEQMKRIVGGYDGGDVDECRATKGCDSGCAKGKYCSTCCIA